MSAEMPAPGEMGVTVVDGVGTIRVYSENATSIQLCVFEPDEVTEVRHIIDLQREGAIWTATSHHLRPGIKYALKADGPKAPRNAFNNQLFLIDPYARGVVRQNAREYHCVVVDDAFDWQGVEKPNIPLDELIVYEAHARGLTRGNPNLPDELRGTYAALGHSTTIEHLKKIGVNAVELLPIHMFISEPRLMSMGLINYWGYNSINFFSPHPRYASAAAREQGPQAILEELKTAIRELHRNGIEVILDVVYNHTAEAGIGGPTLSFRGIDNRAWYRHNQESNYLDLTGCGNTVAAAKPYSVRFIVDSLRWWTDVIGVDGFRFDLATALFKDESARHSSLFAAITAEPVLRDRKMIAEPWDVTRYGLGDFSYPWREWNDFFRDSVRQFWLGDLARGYGEGVSDIASAISGSSGIFYHRGPTASINFITAHDGFTLSDLVSYNEKHNEINREENRDGHSSNKSWNVGVEGETEDLGIKHIRQSLRKSMAATLLLSAGVPMINMGDEVNRTQNGCNNGYSISSGNNPWAQPWQLDDAAQDMQDAFRELINIRKTYLSDVTSKFFTGEVDLGTQRKDLAWFNLTGEEMIDHQWQNSETRTLSVYIEVSAERALLLNFNSDRVEQEFKLPAEHWATAYRCIFDASKVTATYEPVIAQPGSTIKVPEHTAQIWLVTR